MQDAGTKNVPVLPVRNAVLFPLLPMPLNVGRERSLKAIQEAMAQDGHIVILTQREPQVDEPAEEDLYRMGTLAKVIKVEGKLDGGQNTIVQGLARFRISGFTQTQPCIRVDGESIEDPADDPAADIEPQVHHVKALAQKIVKLSPNIPAEASLFLGSLENAGNLADIVAAYLEYLGRAEAGGARADRCSAKAREDLAPPHERARNSGAVEQDPERGQGQHR